MRHNACLEDIDYRSPRGLDKALILQLGSGQWLRDGLNLIIGGPTGVGKTWLACALAHKACRDGYSVRYLRLPRLMEELGLAHGDGRFAKRMAGYAKTDLLIWPDERGIVGRMLVGWVAGWRGMRSPGRNTTGTRQRSDKA